MDEHSFSSAFPLALRIQALLALGLAGWATNLHVLSLLGIDTAAILDIRADHTPSAPRTYLHHSALYRPVYHLAACYAAYVALAWVVFQAVAGGDGDAATGRWLTSLLALVPLAVLFSPTDRFQRRERSAFLQSLKRIVSDSVYTAVPFSHVVLADIWTSYAKVMGDVWISACMLLNAFAVGKSATEGCYKEWGVPLLTSLPYLFRFRQCISEYLSTPSIHIPDTASSHNLSHRHQPSIFFAPSSASSTPSTPRQRSLLNACKYASALPVIIFSALQGPHADPFDGDDSSNPSKSLYFKIWILAVLVNSAFSFWWDVTNDWGLWLLLPSAQKQVVSQMRPSLKSRRSQDNNRPHLSASSSSSTSSPTSYITASRLSYSLSPFLRPTLLLPDNTIYFLAVAIDLLLRLTWSLKLSSHLHEIHEIESGVFLLEGLEVVRRWMWIFLRLEWEAVRKGGDVLEDGVRNTHGSTGHLQLGVVHKPGMTPRGSSLTLPGEESSWSNREIPLIQIEGENAS